MTGELVSHYRILDKIGAGGMGGVTGYCMGGALTFLAIANVPEAEGTGGERRPV